MSFPQRLILLILLLVSCLHNAACSVTPNRDDRLVHNTASLSFGIEANENWIFATVQPDKNSPENKIEGLYIDGITGRMVKAPGSKDIHAVHGTVNTLALLGTLSKPPTRYRWDFPELFNGFSSHNQSEDRLPFSPFYYRGGTVIFRYNEKAEGAAKFNPVYLIPDEWANSVVPAFKFQQANQALFDETKVAANFKPLTALLSDANPFNAIAAARILAPQRGLDTTFILSNLASSTGYTQAIFAYLTFKNAHQLRQEAIDNALGRVIDKASSAATLKWITLGMTTALHDDANSYFALKDRTKTLLLRVDKRQKTLDTKTPDDDYVNELLIVAQVRERPVTPPQTRSHF